MVLNINYHLTSFTRWQYIHLELGQLTLNKTKTALFSAEVYTGIGKPAEATACTQEAANLFPTSHNVLFMRGQVAELRGNTDEAKRWYEEALSISPTHVKTMQRLVWSKFSIFKKKHLIILKTFVSRKNTSRFCI